MNDNGLQKYIDVAHEETGNGEQMFSISRCLKNNKKCYFNSQKYEMHLLKFPSLPDESHLGHVQTKTLILLILL